MTHHEFLGLSLTDMFVFRLYYGEELYGILAQDNASGLIYHIPPSQISEWNNGSKKIQEVGSTVCLDCISSWEKGTQKSSHKPPAPVHIIRNPVVRKLIIVGAGASHDIASRLTDHRLKLPLANELFEGKFNDLLSVYPGAKDLCSALMHTNDIEAYFQSRWEHVVQYYDPLTVPKR